MNPPRITRPKLPKGYVDAPTGEVEWSYVQERLETAKNYWLVSISPKQKPHVIPRWGVWVNDKFYYDGSPETRHAQNLQNNSQVSLHLENGDQAVILNGYAEPIGKPDKPLAEQISAAYRAKYTEYGYSPEANQWDEGGLYVFTPRSVLAWTIFFENPTKFIFED